MKVNARRKMAGSTERLLACLVAIALVMGLCPMQALAAQKPTVGEVLAVMKKYDPDGYYIAKIAKKRGADITVWWHGGSGIEDAGSFDTMVHENCHYYDSYKVKNTDKKYRFYTGNKKSVTVKITKVFKSKKMVKSVPSRLRIRRFNDYVNVGKSDANLTSNVDGVYGLLDEFTAYCWGNNAYVKLYQHARETHIDDGYHPFYEEYFGDNSANSYPEFRYFIEHYLYYAKTHNKKVYKGVMKNKNFIKALRRIDAKFSSVIDEYNRLQVETAAEEGRTTLKNKKTGDYGRYIREYNLYAEELNKKRYRAIEKKLGLKDVKLRDPDALLANYGTGTSAQSSYAVAKTGMQGRAGTVAMG